MYVRCPADIENASDPRVFVCGQIAKINEVEKSIVVKIHDPFDYMLFFDDLPKGFIKLPLHSVEHCSMFIGSQVICRDELCKILTVQRSKSGYYYYYVQILSSKQIFRVSEVDIIASFNNGYIDPASQLTNYEFQNPCWYFGHAVVSRNINILENSIYGFKELAGAKIYLLPHQVNTIMRCLQEKPCRYMLADEVGMGKTIEALSVLKLYMLNRCKQKSLIIVPDTLKAQWEIELLIKFNILVGKNKDSNLVELKAFSEVSSQDLLIKWDFVIIDEVHRYVRDKSAYSLLHSISENAENILLLSATPVQQQRDEYLSLLRLLQPQKYDCYKKADFDQLLNKQSKIVQKTALILDDLGDFEEEIEDYLSENEDAHTSEDCQDLFEEICGGLEYLCEEIADDKLTELLQAIKFEDSDLGVYNIKVMISYICTNYQIESNIIRNRRKILEIDDDGARLMPVRKLIKFKYSLDVDRNTYETLTYKELANFIESNTDTLTSEGILQPLLNAFFSSPWAFHAQLNRLKLNEVYFTEALEKNTMLWEAQEDSILNNLINVIDDPDSYENDYSCRLVQIINILYEDLYDKKVVLFTNYPETFDAYKKALEQIFENTEISFFGECMPTHETELNAYKFQNEPDCRIMLCDYTGGEGRNFQCADYVVHIDLPWDANVIEQRIGRLDRLERDTSRPIVYSVVVYAEGTFEEALFNFWDQGLKIFTQSLSGMEIIMRDVNEEIVSAINDDFQYGLFERIPQIVELANTMRESVRKEQNYDAAGFMFRPMYMELKRLIDYYTQNENILFAESMSNWASLAGFRGYHVADGIISYTDSSFSPKAAINSQLIPPKWNDYFNSDHSIFINSAQNAYSKDTASRSRERSIRGTFIRKIAIENDYLHFFAPGDEIFDCIVENAINSCKGCASAFAVSADVSWKGFIFTWSVSPNEVILLDNNVSTYALGPYRSFLMSEDIITPVSIENEQDYADDKIVREYNQIINAGFYKNKIVHLGKRSREAKYLSSIISDRSNICWFKNEYPSETWADMVNSAKNAALEKALIKVKHRSNIRGAKEEMTRTLSARVANSKLYGIGDDKISALKDELDYVIEAISKPKITLSSAAYVWMVKKSDE